MDRNLDYTSEEFDFELVSHQGEALKPLADGKRTQRYMGALEDNMTAIRPPVVDAPSGHEAEERGFRHHNTLTPG